MGFTLKAFQMEGADWGSNPCTPASANSFMAKSIYKSIVEQDVGLKVSSI